MGNKQWTFRLDTDLMEKTEVLVSISGKSRAEWFRGVIENLARHQVEIGELAIASFHDSAKRAVRNAETHDLVGDAEAAAESRKAAAAYREQIAKYDAACSTLRGSVLSWGA